MANFSVQLPDAEGIVPAPVLEVGPSPLVPILNTLSQGVSQFSDDMKERARKKKEDAEAAKQAREQESRGFVVDQLLAANASESNVQATDPYLELVNATPPAGNFASEGAGSSGPAGTLDPAGAIVEGAVNSGAVSQETVNEIAQAVAGDAEAYQNTQTAVSQGALPATAQRAHVDRILQEARARFPDVDPDVLLAVMDKAGVKSHLFRYLGKNIDDYNANEKGRREFITKAREKGMEILGPAAAGLEDQAIIAKGWEAIQQEQQMEAIKTDLEIQKARGDLTDREIERNNRQAADSMRSVFTQQFYTRMSPYIESVNKIIGMMPEAGANPALEEKFGIAMDEMNTQMQIVKEQMRAEILAHPAGSPELADKIVGQFEESYTNTILTPIENRDKRTSELLSKLQDRLGLGMMQAYPFISAMKNLGISMQLTDVLIETSSPETRERLASEIGQLNNFNMYDIMERNSGMLQVAEIASILMGNKTLQQLDITPQQASKIFKTVNGVVKELRVQLDKGDYAEADAYLNGMAEVAVAAGELSPAADLRALVNASTSLGGASSRVLVRLANGAADGVDQEYAQAIGLGARAGMANVLNGLRQKDKTFGFHSVVYNDKTLKWEVQFNRRAWEQSPASRGAVGDPMDTKLGIRQSRAAVPEAPAEARATASALNNAQGFLVETASIDEGTPQGLNKKELALWYSQGRVPRKVQEELSKQEKESKATPANVLKSIESFRDSIRQQGFDFDIPAILDSEGNAVDPQGNVVTRGASGQKVTVESPDNLRAKYGDSPVFKAVERIAQKTGIPVEVALTLAGHEGKFNPKARANAGKGRTAYGPMQVVDAFHDKTAQARYGKRVKDLSPEQNVDLGLFILAENYKAAGNWTDAMAMYHSGVTLEEARRQNRSDGNIATADYIEALAAAAGIEV